MSSSALKSHGLILAMNTYAYEPTPAPPPQIDTDALSELFETETRIVRGKLEVLAAEIHGRIVIHANNVNRIDRDQEVARETLERLDRLARYHFREHSEKGIFYRTLFALEQERRTQDVECWRDIVLVMRDFILVWETHERIKAKGRLFADAG
jgi:hypothetical protein